MNRVPQGTPLSDSDLVPISALQHLLFCERQCALIHLERIWAENPLTLEGRHVHERVHGGEIERRAGITVTRGLPLRSERLGLIGRADLVDFHADGRIVPVEYKRGKSKRNDCDRVQLCAQALCLEEMCGRPVERGELYYGRSRRRVEVLFEHRLRSATAAAVTRLRQLLSAGVTPRARREPKCRQCSLLDLCLPGGTAPGKSAAQFVARALAASLEEEDAG